MTRPAIFVDAGYLFAQGSAALAGEKQPRSLLKLDETAVIAAFSKVAAVKTNRDEILRIYWYDGVAGYQGPSLEQTRLANLDNVKLRLGFINSHGQQKGVDSLIVTDLIELARNHAICDAILLSGDEDVRIGVQVAQSFGVRVHLIGIVPSRGSQSRQLLQEADTTTEWDKDTVAKFLTVEKPKLQTCSGSSIAPVNKAVNEAPGRKLQPEFEAVVQDVIGRLDNTQIEALKSHWIGSRDVPPEFDGKLLARCRAAIGRDLTADEKRHVRARFRATVTALA